MRFDEATRDSYIDTMFNTIERDAPWVLERKAPPESTITEYKYAVDYHSVCLHVTLANHLLETAQRLKRPLPPAQHIVPATVSMWNHMKGERNIPDSRCIVNFSIPIVLSVEHSHFYYLGGVDVYSRFMTAFASGHHHTASHVIFLRCMGTLFFNAFLTDRLLQVGTDDSSHSFQSLTRGCSGR